MSERLETLKKRRASAWPTTSAVYRFDIHLQGDNETVFFDI
jgi:protocatechuate 3,4-dioxygenase beta subunit